MLSSEYIKECVSYNRETGDFFWLKRPERHFKNKKAATAFNCRFPGKRLSSISHSGYKSTIISGHGIESKKHYLHRLAWLYEYGEWPDNIDHINGNTKDNRICNLRSVTHQVNLKNCKLSKNNTSGVNGVRFNKNINRWVARIFDGGVDIHLGVSDNLLDACCMRKSAESKQGFHENHGMR
jgi:hypothetical protein